MASSVSEISLSDSMWLGYDLLKGVHTLLGLPFYSLMLGFVIYSLYRNSLVMLFSQQLNILVFLEWWKSKHGRVGAGLYSVDIVQRVNLSLQRKKQYLPFATDQIIFM